LDPTSSDLPVPDYVQELETNIAGLRVGVPTNHFFEHCDCEIAKAVNAAVEVLEGLGCTKVEFEFPSISEIMAAYTTIDLCEASAYHEREIEQRAADFQPDVRLLLEQGLLIPASYYIQAQRVRAMLFAKVMSLFDHLDVIVTPSVPIVSPQVSQTIVRIDDYEESVDSAAVRYLAPFNLTGLPALSIPCGFSSKGLPIGMQIAGRAYDESTILRLGHEYENATEWHMRLPETS
jgi:aspartyl-tRNA(Asn)/glutamyl-tRNA(Gln) amidotransferase subunit A